MEKFPESSQTNSDYENIQEKEKQKTQPLSVEFFNTTEEGKELKEKILAGLPALKKYNSLDLEQFKITEYLSYAKAKYFLGEDYNLEIQKAYDLAYSPEVERQKYDTMKTNFWERLLTMYTEMELPPDSRIEKMLEYARSPYGEDELQINRIAGISSSSKRDGMIRRIATLYFKNGDYEKAARLYDEIQSNDSKVIFLCDFSETTDYSEQKDKILQRAKELLLMDHDSNHYGPMMATKKLVSTFIDNGNYNEFELLFRLKEDQEILHTLVELANKENTPDKYKEIFLHKALLLADKITDSSPDKNNNYGRIASVYANLGQKEKTNEILEHCIKNVTFQPSTFYEEFSPKSLVNNYETRQIIGEFILKQDLFSDVHKTLFGRETARVLATMGAYENGIKIITDPKISTQGLIGEEWAQFTEGINDNLVARKQEKNRVNQTEPIINAKALSTPNRAFIAGWVFGKSNEINLDECPPHIKLAYEMGESFFSTSPSARFDIGASNDLLSINTFLRTIEYHKLKNLPEAFDKMLGVFPEEGDAMVYEYIATNPEAARRLIKVLISIDADKGTRYAHDLMVRKSTPDRIFSYFAHTFIKNGKYTEKLKKYIGNQNNLPSIRRLASQYPNQFNTTIDILAGLNVEEIETEKALWDALNDLHTLSPKIYEKYRTLNQIQRKEFVTQLNEFDYSSFFKNKPVFNSENTSHNNNLGDDIKTDLLYRAYAPINMSYTQVQALLPQVKDRTKDLDGYNFNEEYLITLQSPGYVLRHGEQIDNVTLGELRTLFNPEFSATTNLRNESALKLARATTDFTSEETAALFSVLKNTPQYKIAQLKFFPKNMPTFHELTSLKELLGVFTEDTLGKELVDAIVSEDKISKKFLQLVESPVRRNNLLKALGYHIDNEFTKDIPTVDLMSRLFSQKVLSKYQVLINKELRKFIESSAQETNAKKATAYISKNQGSFFAKASAGICTSGDIVLWDMPHHFHINTVDENQIVRGNTMGYIETINNEQSLVLRGFNPTTQFSEEITAESFVEEMIRVARDFKEKNQLAHIYLIIGNTRDSNRVQIQNYIQSKYATSLEKVPHKMKVAGSGEIDTVFLLE